MQDPKLIPSPHAKSLTAKHNEAKTQECKCNNQYNPPENIKQAKQGSQSNQSKHNPKQLGIPNPTQQHRHHRSHQQNPQNKVNRHPRRRHQRQPRKTRSHQAVPQKQNPQPATNPQPHRRARSLDWTRCSLVRGT
ncbi:uncharacterized protein BO72DRAFT_293857 [Aspergillus fijiensis CBS 313.89]|uniref:Uncharacterized protein n=1 Tax=Aspergillus fijiensis CBS 313.89 TaxID=1448319 RepID=A0A8G1VWI3_9EURO|nr:uncharacterized protein BO72DRAFT_293857 [Aspergillus fijiensis CBS 313.89]RAK72019.1 hypothetical protein BO72DRAFT_293857 [Aspergillus fijiensis CBS 313.89]